VEDAGVIDFHSAETHILLNPRMPEEEREALTRRAAAAIPQLPAHVIVATSGSTGAFKLVALSKEAILASAAAVNEHLGATAADDWACVLPMFHVGGLGIFARAQLCGARVFEAPWEPRGFARLLAAERIAFSALVPAQVRDLVRDELSAPATLRAVVVGGGALDDDTYAAASRLGWPLLRSYGLTECCSQVATERYDSPELQVLPHLEVRSETDGRIAIRGASLLTAYINEEEIEDPKRDGWFVTEDLGWVEERVLRVEGRAGEFVKIGGESVDLARLDRIMAEVAENRAAVVAVPDERLGHVITAASTVEPAEIVEEFNRRVLPFERIRRAHRVGEIPRSPLGKLLRTRLLEIIEGLE
jgi:O-succinylbenzoic acid--CoA ligase